MSNLISIYTLTMGGRDHYLLKLVEKVKSQWASNLEWYIGLQGVKFNSLDIVLQQALKDSNIHVLEWETNVGAGEGNNKIIPLLKGDIICKLDDDALPQSDDYFLHVDAISSCIPSAIFSPYPVGLINNPGGPPKHSPHKTVFSESMNTYYTLRPVSHVGGFARIGPASLIKQMVWPNDLNGSTSGSEDVNFSRYCNTKHVPMYYLENSLIVEHQESTLGQHQRIANYFGSRF